MSRIGKRKIIIPSTVTLTPSNNNLNIKGPMGVLDVNYDSSKIKVNIDKQTVSVEPLSSAYDMLWGTINANINTAIKGVVEGFVKELHIEGVGFKAALKGQQLVLNLGFSHEVVLDIPKTIKVETLAPTEIKISGPNKQLVGQFASEIRIWRKPEPYNGKGVIYKNEHILRKVGKTAEGTKTTK